MHSPHKTLAALLLLSSWTFAQYSSYITFLYSDARTTVTVSYIYTPPLSLRTTASLADATSAVPSAIPAASITSAQQSSIQSSLASSISSSLSTAAAGAIPSAASTRTTVATTTFTTTTGAGALATNAAVPVSNRRSGLSTGAIIGLSVGLGILGLLLLLGLIFCCFFMRKRKKRKAAVAAASQREDEKAGELSSSDVNVPPSNYPAPVAVPAGHHDSREPTLPALSFEKEATPTFSPVAEPGHGHEPISNAIPVASGAEAAATVEALANQNKPWAPSGYKPYRASTTASPMADFDFGLGHEGQGSSGWKAHQRHSIPRRPVGNS